MEIPILASFRWVSGELLSAQRVHMRYSSSGRKFRRAVFITGPLAILFGIGILVTHGIHPVGLFFIIIGAALLASPLFARRMTLKHYAQRPDRDMLVSWEFYPDRIISKTEASSASMEWRMISRVLRTKQGFLLYPNDRIFHWLPIHAFRQSTDIESFAQLAKSNVKHFDHVA
jgi:hypothetical protein